MGVLDKAKNGDKQFWNIEISCSQWEGSACTQSALIFLILSFVWVGEGFFFIFPLFPTCSLQVPNGFPSGSHGVPNMFPGFSMCFSICPPNSTSHYPRSFAFLTLNQPKSRIPQYKYFGTVQSLIFYFYFPMGWSQMPIIHTLGVPKMN